jgi:hypothetical protein
MAKDKIKKGFAALKDQRSQTPKTKAPIQEVKTEAVVKPVSKMGRPSTKDPDVNYVKFGGWIKEDTKIRMQMALLTSCRGFHTTQEEIVETAINFYLDSIEEN